MPSTRVASLSMRMLLPTVQRRRRHPAPSYYFSQLVQRTATVDRFLACSLSVAVRTTVLYASSASRMASMSVPSSSAPSRLSLARKSPDQRPGTHVPWRWISTELVDHIVDAALDSAYVREGVADTRDRCARPAASSPRWLSRWALSSLESRCRRQEHASSDERLDPSRTGSKDGDLVGLQFAGWRSATVDLRWASSAAAAAEPDRGFECSSPEG